MAVNAAGAISHLARPTKAPSTKPQPITTVAQPKAKTPRWCELPAINHTEAPTTVAAPIVNQPSVARGGRGRAPRPCVAHFFHRSPLDPSAVAMSAGGRVAGSASGGRPRHSATAAPSRTIAMTQPAFGRLAPPPNSHRADTRAAATPSTRRTTDGGGDEGESASNKKPAT